MNSEFTFAPPEPTDVERAAALMEKYDGGQLRTTPLMCTVRQPSAVHVVQCEHRWDAQKQPRHNCGYCWYVYFQIHPAEVVAGESTMRVYGDKVIEKSKGSKYLKALKQAVKRKQWEEEQERLASLTATSKAENPSGTSDTLTLPNISQDGAKTEASKSDA